MIFPLLLVVPVFCCCHVGHPSIPAVPLTNRPVLLCSLLPLSFRCSGLFLHLEASVCVSVCVCVYVHVCFLCVWERERWLECTLLEGQQEHEHHVDDDEQHHDEEHHHLLSLRGEVAAQHGGEESHPLPAPPPRAAAPSHQSPGLLLFLLLSTTAPPPSPFPQCWASTPHRVTSSPASISSVCVL